VETYAARLAGAETPELSILSGEFLDALADKEKPNLQMGPLRRLINDEIKIEWVYPSGLVTSRHVTSRHVTSRHVDVIALGHCFAPNARSAYRQIFPRPTERAVGHRSAAGSVHRGRAVRRQLTGLDDAAV